MPYLDIIGWPLILIAFAEIYLGVILLKKNPRNSSLNKSVAILSFAAASLCLSGGISYVLAGMGLDYSFVYRGNWLGYFCIPAAFHISFYLKDEKTPAPRTAVLTHYFPWVIIAVLAFFTDLVEKGPPSLTPHVLNTGPLANPARILASALIVWLIFRLMKIRTQLIGIKTVQINYVITGIVLFGIGSGLVSGILPLFGSFGVDPALGGYFSLPWIVLTFYAITRYRLFDFRMFMSNLFLILILTSVMSGFFLGLWELLERLTGTSQSIVVPLLIAGIALISLPIFKIFQNKIQRIVMKGKYDYQMDLIEASRSFITIKNLDNLLRSIISALKTNLGVKHAYIFLRTEFGSYKVHGNPDDGEKLPFNYWAADNVIDWLKLNGEILIKEEQEMTLPSDNFKRLYKNIGKIDAELIMPLIYNNDLQGFITLGYKSSKESYSKSDIYLLNKLTVDTVLAIEDSLIYEKTFTDSLTGLFIQQYFNKRLKEEIKLPENQGPISLLMIDVDYFEGIREKHGYAMGDEVLKEISEVIKNKARFGNLIARYSEKQFALLLPNTSRPEALAAANDLRMKIRELTFGHDDKTTVSIGIGCFGDTEDLDYEDLIKQAENALYIAKLKGKDRVEYLHS